MSNSYYGYRHNNLHPARTLVHIATKVATDLKRMQRFYGAAVP